MTACRIARRVALTWAVENRRIQAVSAQTLATKVFHLTLQSCPHGGGPGGLRVAGEPRVKLGRMERESRAVGVRLEPQRGDARRVAWQPASSATPSVMSALATKESRKPS
jgi:hypothetical protein